MFTPPPVARSIPEKRTPLRGGKAKEPVGSRDLQATRHVERAKGALAQRDGHHVAGIEGELAFPIEGHHASNLLAPERLIGPHPLPATDAHRSHVPCRRTAT